MKHLKAYYEFLKCDKRLHDNLSNFAAFSLSELPKYDLDAKVIIVGAARVGKSTHFFQIARRIFVNKLKTDVNSVDRYLLSHDFITDSIIYTRDQSLKRFKSVSKSIISFDETYLVADKRETMNTAQINITKFLDVFALQNNVVFALTQQLSDLDSRVVNKATVLYLDYQRSKSLLYAKNHSFPLLPQTFDFDYYIKNPWQLDHKPQALSSLKHRRGFVGTNYWNDMEGVPLYENYHEYKQNQVDKLNF